MRNRILLWILFAIVAVFAGCRAKPEEVVKIPYDNPLAPGAVALRKITNPADIPDFTMAALDLKGLRDGIDRSLNYLNKPSSKRYFPCAEITHKRALDSLNAFAELLDSGLVGRRLNDAIRDRFDVYTSVGYDDQGTVLFTGYYTPVFNGSLKPSGRFKYSLSKQPENLVKNVDGQILGRRGSDGQVTPYPPRAVIENAHMTRGNELVWLEDPFEAYIAHVQGSAKIRMPDGKLMGVGYAANNGHEYRSISKLMVKDGLITEGQLSLSAMIDYFKRNKDMVKRYVQRNPRYVFFKKEDGQPRGSLNEPVTTMRTIATDKSIFPRGSITFLKTYLPRSSGGAIRNDAYTGFALDQDTGGAIRAPGRCDVYMGVGDTAGKLAGQTYQEGRLYYLFLRE